MRVLVELQLTVMASLLESMPSGPMHRVYPPVDWSEAREVLDLDESSQVSYGASMLCRQCSGEGRELLGLFNGSDDDEEIPGRDDGGGSRCTPLPVCALDLDDGDPVAASDGCLLEC